MCMGYDSNTKHLHADPLTSCITQAVRRLSQRVHELISTPTILVFRTQKHLTPTRKKKQRHSNAVFLDKTHTKHHLALAHTFFGVNDETLAQRTILSCTN